MMKRILALTGLATMMFTASISHAIYLEPYLGLYSLGSVDSTSVAGNASYDLSGTLGYGLRAGYSLMGFSFGLEYQGGNMNSKQTAGSQVGSTDTVAVTNIGAFAGFDVPVIPICGYVGYLFSAKGSFSTAGVTDTGTGTKIGVGFTGLPFVHINLEYLALKYDTINPALAGFSANAKSYMLSVSLPLNF